MIPDWTSYRYTAHPARIRISLVLGLLAISASVATIYAAPIEGVSHLTCGLQALDCTKALTSKFAKIGDIPLGVFGVFYFSFWTLNLRAFQMTSNDGYRWALSWVTVVGAVASTVLGIIMFFVLKAPCGYCLLTHVCNLGSFILLWPVRQWRMKTAFTSEQFRHFLAITAISVLCSACLQLASQVRTLKAQAESIRRTIW